jgi:hypothetical protein
MQTQNLSKQKRHQFSKGLKEFLTSRIAGCLQI